MSAHPTPNTTDAPVWPPATQAERDRVRDAAIDEAYALRRTAIADFWRGADALLLDAVDHGRRAADRLAARLRRRALTRAA
jgi:hypothetical protein